MARGFIKRYTPDEYRQRPTEFDPLLADKICRMISNGEMLPVICDDPDMPLPGDFLRWVDEDPILEKAYVQARRRGAEVTVDEMVAATETTGKDLGLMALRSRALEQHAKMTDPSRYGPRAAVRVTEEEEGGIDYRDEVRRKLADLSKKMKAAREAEQKSRDGSSPEG